MRITSRQLVALGSLALLLAACVAGPAGGPGTLGSGQRASGGDGTGPITLAVGAEDGNHMRELVDQWNATHAGQEVTIIDLPRAADEQRAQMVTNLQAQSDRYDVLNLDVVWTAEFAASGWITPLDRRRFPLDDFLEPAVETARYRGKLYAVPYTSNAGVLYYRKDILRKEREAPPRTWAELRRLARRLGPKYEVRGYAGQFLPYEGLTANFTEAVRSRGGEILSDDGTRVVLDASSAEGALEDLIQGLREGWIPEETLNYKEEEAREAFLAGDLLFMRNWLNARGIGERPGPGNEVAGKVGIARLPGPTGPGSSTLGGANLAISSFSRHQRTALEFITYFTTRTKEHRVFANGSFPPAWKALYDDPELVRSHPYLPVLKESILAARPRPHTASYNQVSLVIANAASEALARRKPVKAAVAEMTRELTEIVQSSG